MTKSQRQQYGIGSFVKKIARGAKKAFKSPLGKAALIGGLGMIPFGTGASRGSLFSRGIGALGRFGRNRGILGAAASPNKYLATAISRGGAGGRDPSLLSRGWQGLKDFGLGKAALLGGGALATALPFMGVDEEEEEIFDDFSVTPDSIASIRDMARRRDPSLAFLPNQNYVQSGYYLKDGGIASLANGGGAGNAQAEQMLKMEYQKYRNQGGTMSYQQFKMQVLQQAQAQGPMAQGQRAPQGYANGELVTDESMMAETPTGMMEENIEEVQGEPSREQLESLAMEIFQLPLEELDEEKLMIVYQAAMEMQPQEEMMQEEDIQMAAYGGRIKKNEGGIMDLGGMEKDYRNEGGFVALGGKERADDVPARLSKNEFVMTADAVRGAGGGNIDKGAEVMQNMMNNLEAGGKMSEDSQGAQGMYNNMKQLETRIA